MIRVASLATTITVSISGAMSMIGASLAVNIPSRFTKTLTSSLPPSEEAHVVIAGIVRLAIGSSRGMHNEAPYRDCDWSQARCRAQTHIMAVL